MKIAIIASGLPPDIRGGGEISSQVLADSLARAGADVHALCCAGTEQRGVAEGVDITRIKSPNIYWNFGPEQSGAKKLVWHALENFNPVSGSAIRHYLREIEPDLVVTSTMENFGAEAWRAPATLGIKSVHILRSYYPMCWRGTVFRHGENCAGACIDCRVLTFGRRTASQLVNGVVGLSNATLDKHIDAGLFTNAARALIPDPVATHDPVASPRQLTRPPVFGYLGFLSPNKGIETIADALRLGTLPAETKVLIAGKGDDDYVASLKARFEGLNAEFVGWVKNDRFLGQVEFLIVPSIWHEPFGRIVVEAFYEGTPVIGSNMGGIGEMVTPGRTGFTFPAGDGAALAQAMASASGIDPAAYTELSRAALDAAKGYTGDVVARRYLDFFETVVGNTAGTGAGP